MVELQRWASTYIAVGGLLLFGTITSLLAKIGECPVRCIDRRQMCIACAALPFACNTQHEHQMFPSLANTI
jgi:hypothetical protein